MIDGPTRKPGEAYPFVQTSVKIYLRMKKTPKVKLQNKFNAQTEKILKKSLLFNFFMLIILKKH